MLDQVVWILGRPEKVTTFLRNDTGVVPAFQDNTLGVFEYERAMAWVDIAAMEPQPMARRFEVYGDRGSAILLEPFEPGHAIRLCLTEAADGYTQGEQMVPFDGISRQGLYELELASSCAFSRANTDQIVHSTTNSSCKRPCCAGPGLLRPEPCLGKHALDRRDR